MEAGLPFTSMPRRSSRKIVGAGSLVCARAKEAAQGRERSADKSPPSEHVRPSLLRVLETKHFGCFII